MQNFIKKVVWFCLALIPFIALYVADGGTFDPINWGTQGFYFPFISGKNFLFRFIVEIAFAGWAILALRDATYRVNIKKSPLTIAYAVFMLVILVADIFAVDSSKAIWSNYERMEGFVGHIHMFGYFFVLTAMLTTLKSWQNMFKIFLASNLLVLIYAYGQLFGAKGYIFAEKFPAVADKFSLLFPIHQSENRLDATIGNSAYFAIFCLMSLSIAGLLWSQQHNLKKAWWYPTIIALNLVALFYSGTRGTIIGLFAGTLLTLGIIAWKEKGHARKVLIGVLVAVIVGVSSLFAFKNSDFIKSTPTLNRLASISPTELTTMSRFSVWKISYQAFLEKPILGYGQDNFSYIYARNFLPEKMWNLEPWYDRSHDVFFDWLVAGGILGLLSYLSLYLVALWLMWFKPHDMPLRERAILTGVLGGYFVHNIFVFDNLTSYILFFALLAYIVMRTHGDTVRAKGKELVTEETMNLIVAPIIFIMLIGAQYYVNYRPYLVNISLIKGMSIGQLAQTMPLADAIKISQDSFTKALALNTLGSEETREQFLQMGIRVGQINVPPETPALEKQAIGQAINNFIMTVRKDAEDILPIYKEDVRMLSIFGMFYNGMGDAVSGEKVLTSAHNFAPNKQLISFDLVRSYLMQNKYKEAFALAKETYDLEPVYPSSQKWLLISAIYLKDYKNTKDYIISKSGDSPFDGDVLNAAISSDQISLAVEMLNDVKKKNPEYTQQVDDYIKKMLASVKK
ncbi:MAG: O-antigen ligase family protein [Candidatus Nomurabacteria bacterium]|nr:O-antigen ligase family protein [Candidatus Nomurabacteria bacterium]